MTPQSSDRDGDHEVLPVNASRANPPLEDLKTQWTHWLRRVSKDVIQPKAYKAVTFLANAVTFALFILADLGTIFLVGLVFADIIDKYPFLGYLYDGIKIASVLVITIHCLVLQSHLKDEAAPEAHCRSNVPFEDCA